MRALRAWYSSTAARVVPWKPVGHGRACSSKESVDQSLTEAGRVRLHGALATSNSCRFCEHERLMSPQHVTRS